MPTAKTEVIELLFRSKQVNGTLTDPVVTLRDVSTQIRAYNQGRTSKRLSDNNPANFFKDFIRVKKRANENWPAAVLAAGYSGRQLTGDNQCFEFVPLPAGQQEAFPQSTVFAPQPNTPHFEIESVSLPLASRRLGRSDEPWLIQVLVKQRIIETHLALNSPLPVIQVDHLQMSVKLTRVEIDALFLLLESTQGSGTHEVIVTCEGKGLRDDILEDQVIRQARAAFNMPHVDQTEVLPMAVKTIGPSQLYVVEFEKIGKADASTLESLTIASDGIYTLKPSVPGIGI